MHLSGAKLIRFLKRFFQHILPKQQHFSLISDPEARIKADHVEMASQYLETEAVDRRDLRIMDQDQLTL